MNTSWLVLIGVCVLALVIIAFFAVFRGRGKFRIKSILGEATAEGENLARSEPVAKGVSIKNASAGGDISAHSETAGGIDLQNVTTRKNITAEHLSSDPPPKP